jgi:hypothetical protein
MNRLFTEEAKRKRLEQAGWKSGSVADFLEFTTEEIILVEIKLALSPYLKTRRQDSMTQLELAEKIHSSQPRIAKAKNGEVSIELMLGPCWQQE